MRRLATLLLSTACCVPLLAFAAPRYTVNSLGLDITNVTHINNDGEVAGNRLYDIEGNVFSAPFWTAGNSTGNSSLDSITQYGNPTINAINNIGGATGRMATGGPEGIYAFAKPSIDGPLVRIDPTAGITDMNPASISEERSDPYIYVAGNASVPGSQTQAFRWAMYGASPGAATMQLLGTLGGTNSHANAVNVAGQVTGWAETANGERHAYLYENGAMQDLGTPGGQSVGNALNEAGTVVGDMRLDPASPATRGFVWNDGQIDYIGTLGGASSTALDINNRGWVVGSSALADGGRHGYLYIDGELIDLNTLLAPGSGWTVYDALSINDQGDIVVYGTTGENFGYAVLTVPEPRAWALLAVGLPLLLARRRPTDVRLQM
jgi:probable HAF family extracellular repeat protein